MPIKWSTLRVTGAMDMAEDFINQAAEPLESAKIVVEEARSIANLPGYLDQRLVRLIIDIERIDYIKSSIKAVRQSIPDGATEAEQEKVKYGSQQSLV